MLSAGTTAFYCCCKQCYCIDLLSTTSQLCVCLCSGAEVCGHRPTFSSLTWQSQTCWCVLLRHPPSSLTACTSDGSLERKVTNTFNIWHLYFWNTVQSYKYDLNTVLWFTMYMYTQIHTSFIFMATLDFHKEHVLVSYPIVWRAVQLRFCTQTCHSLSPFCAASQNSIDHKASKNACCLYVLCAFGGCCTSGALYSTSACNLEGMEMKRW